MKKKVLISIAILIAVFLVSLPLTRYRADEKIYPLNLPLSILELDSYLVKTESQYSDIVPGAEKKIVWASPNHEQTEYSIVYIHGFSASRQEVAPLPDLLAKDLNANIFYTRLKGHARSPQVFGDFKTNDWLNDSVEAFEIGRKIGKKVILLGTSTGCALITWLAGQEKYSRDIASLVFISPNFYPANKMLKLFMYPAGVEFVKLVYGKERYWKPENETVARYWNHKYRWEAVTSMIVLIEKNRDIRLDKIKIPALFMYTPNDNVIDTEIIREKFTEYGGKDKKLLKLSQCKNHIMAGDAYSPETTPLLRSEITGFLKQAGMH